MADEDLREMLLAQQEVIALLRAGQVQTCIDLDDLRSKARQQFERIGRIEYAIDLIQRRLDNHS